jgi:APA family basic amino acid/polyamine antiporter
MNSGMTQTSTPSTAPTAPGESQAPALVRHMGLFALVIYGVGDMLGAGVYGLVGKATNLMGNGVWLAFAVSMVAALLTGLSYASIGSRYPRAAGAAYVTHRAFRLPFVSYVVGLAVMCSGLTSMAAASNVFADYFYRLVPGALEQTPHWVRIAVILGFIAFLTIVNLVGMRESTWMNAICTTVELGGLLLVIVVGVRYIGGVNYLDFTSHRNPAGTFALPVMFSASLLTFYAFIGFEDILNVCEEVKEPRRTVPRGLILALLITTAVYMTISVVAVSVVPQHELGDPNLKGPLVEVVKRAAPWFPVGAFTAISLFAVANTALLNYIMGSRLVYGMSRQGLLPAALGRVHARRRTPHVAILTLMVIVLLLALPGSIKQLADATSLLLLSVFVIVNTSLIVLKRRPGEPPGGFEVPLLVPAAGVLVCGTLIGARVLSTSPDDRKALLTAAALLVGIAVLYLVVRPKNVVADDDDPAAAST